jgi:hypothetical protein
MANKNKEMTKKNKEKGCQYLMFCEECNSPKLLSKFIIVNYLQNLKVDNFLCSECGHQTNIPQHLLDILDELVNAI